MSAMSTEGAASVFTYGVASGDVSHDGVVLWAKLAEPGGSVQWFCEPVDPVALARGSATPQGGTAASDPETGSVHAMVQGLEAGTQYR